MEPASVQGQGVNTLLKTQTLELCTVFNPFTPKSDQFLIQPHQTYYITQYGELGFS